MSDDVVVVRNLETGLEHTVQAGHWAVEDDGYEIVKQKRSKKRTSTKSSKSKSKKGAKDSAEE